MITFEHFLYFLAFLAVGYWGFGIAFMGVIGIREDIKHYFKVRKEIKRGRKQIKNAKRNAA